MELFLSPDLNFSHIHDIIPEIVKHLNGLFIIDRFPKNSSFRLTKQEKRN